MGGGQGEKRGGERGVSCPRLPDVNFLAGLSISVELMNIVICVILLGGLRALNHLPSPFFKGEGMWKLSRLRMY